MPRVWSLTTGGAIFLSKGLKDMYRFYCADADFARSSITISESHEIHHIKDVLRLQKGSLIQIFNGFSEEADGLIEEIREDAIVVRVKAVRKNEREQAKIILACAPPKKGKFEFIIEKCTELGVDEIIPLKTKRSAVVFDAERMTAKLSRFEAVAVNAAKQSKRTRVPQISPMTSLPEVLQNLDPNGVHLFPSLHNHPQHMADVLLKAGKSRPVTLLIGPEGDFTPDELALAVKHGCIPVSLGDTVLKVETAAIAAVALVKFLCRN
jgi:16S rRNA (uracil1498-N3)-methyltransferase